MCCRWPPKDLQHLEYGPLAVGGLAENPGPLDRDGAGTERKSVDDIASTPHAAVIRDLATAGSLGDAAGVEPRL